MTRILASSLVAAVALGCMGSSGPTVSPHVSAAQQSSASASMGISFPPETQFLLYHRASEEPALVPGPDDTVHLKIELPSAVAAKLLAAHPFNDARWDASAKLIADVPDWREWKPSTVKKSRSSQIALPRGEALNVLVDEDDPDKAIVYLVWFET
jgi:hypothetical protein